MLKMQLSMANTEVLLLKAPECKQRLHIHTTNNGRDAKILNIYTNSNPAEDYTKKITQECLPSTIG
jgi:hypothetical protein